jgi:hypothetical protein
MKFFTWNSVELETMSDVISRKVISGEKAMVAQVFLKKDAVVPERGERAPYSFGLKEPNACRSRCNRLSRSL